MADGGGYLPERDFGRSPTVWEFIECDSFVSGIRGPLGSGKSVGCVCKVGKKAMEQMPGADGYRRTRAGIIRNTYPELLSTTIKTWEEVFHPAHCGVIKYSHPIVHRIKVRPNGFRWIDRARGLWEGTPGLDLEALFIALNNPQDVKHLKSLDLSFAWINEAVEVPFDVLDMLTGRVGRFPPKEDVPTTWAGIMMDTNASDDQSWWYKVAEQNDMLGFDLSQIHIPGAEDMHLDLSWKFFAQPPAVLEVEPTGDHFVIVEPGYAKVAVPENQLLPAAGKYWFVNPASENLPYLRPGYYHQQVMNKTEGWIKRFLQSKYIYFQDGKPWVPEYSDEAMARELKYNPDLPLYGGIDIGGGTLNPAAVIGQRGPYGDWRILSEVCVFDIGVDRFTDFLLSHIAERYEGRQPIFGIDPAAAKRDETYEVAVELHLRSKGLNVRLAPTNAQGIRRDALALPMGRSVKLPNGAMVPGFMLDKGCSILRAALGGKWHLRRVNTTGRDAKFSMQPDKIHPWSDVGDACAYMTLTFGEHAILTRGRRPQAPQGDREGLFLNRQPAQADFSQPVQADINFNPLANK